MWSEIFFQNFSEGLKQLTFGRFSYSNKDIEYTLFEDLKSEPYQGFIEGFNKAGIDYPEVYI